jgi:hypothetical protein
VSVVDEHLPATIETANYPAIGARKPAHDQALRPHAGNG